MGAAEKRDETPPIEPANDQRVLRDWYTTAEAAKYIGLKTKEGVKTLVFRGKLKPDHWGGRDGLRGHRFSRATLDAYINTKGQVHK